jgi:hypothetical protein
MRGSRIVVAVAAAAAIALPASTALAATTGHTAGPRSDDTHTVTTFVQPPVAKSLPVIVSCANKLQVRPKSYLLSCGDGSAGLTRLRWSSWTAGEATASGNFAFNTCTPNCAQGKFITSPVLVVLWRTSAAPHHAGQQEFLRMTVIYTGKRPAHSAQSFTERLWYPVLR